MNGALTTLKQAREYAEGIERITGKKHHIFHVKEGTFAYEVGYRFGTCETGEVALYKLDGAEFVEGEVDDSQEPTTGGSP
jgi:hypothetical protein